MGIRGCAASVIAGFLIATGIQGILLGSYLGHTLGLLPGTVIILCGMIIFIFSLAGD